MRHFILATLFVIGTIGLTQAQITITADDFPEVGDTLFSAVDNLPTNIDVQPTPGQHSWDFTSLQAPFTRRQIVRTAVQGPAFNLFPGADLLMETGATGDGYYNVENGRFELIGFSGTDPLGIGLEVATPFSPPYLERRAPLNFFDVNQMESALLVAFDPDDLPIDLFSQLPISPDSLRVRVAINRLDAVDGYGTLTIPGGIYDVLREKRTEIREVRMDAKLPFVGWNDVTDIVIELVNFPTLTDQLGKDTITTYNFYSNEAKEPIAIVTSDEDGQNVTSVEFKANDIVNNVQDLSRLKPGVYAFPNPAIVNVRFEFSNLPKGKYYLKIYNILGVEVWHKAYDIDNNYIEKVEISQLRKGTYLYSLTNEKGKTVMTKRLVVVRP
ncbi:MAG: hypothetical protein DHS20C18_32620 [Saprospiraceae bacterium]|nr:MAG: hypothetical protein DHS20C18_32620 [Saprospiraceae bacterium]